MLVNSGYWINDSYSTQALESNITPKFDYIYTQANQFASLTLELWSVRVNGKIIKKSEYGTGARPLTSLKVGYQGESVTVANYFNVGLGYDNYTKFINNICKRHGLYTRFYPMGKNYNISDLNGGVLVETNIFGNHIGVSASIVEDFALTFVERPSNIDAWTNNNKNYSAYNQDYIFHVESASPLSITAAAKIYSPPFNFNIVTSLYGRYQTLIDQISWVTDNRYD